MTRVLSIDLGKQMGWGLLGGPKVRSGSLSIVARWSPLGQSLILLDDKIQGLVRAHKPQYLACARPFVRTGIDGAMIDTPQNLVPMFGGFAVLNIVAARNRLPLEVIEESAARSIMLGDFMPQGSERVKAAIVQACRDRGWPVCDDHAGDALCIASAVTERLCPDAAHLTTPLFGAAGALASKRQA